VTCAQIEPSNSSRVSPSRINVSPGSVPMAVGMRRVTSSITLQSAIAVADLASETDLPLGVVRVLLADLRERGLVAVDGPAGRANSEENVLRSVLDGLRAL